MKSRTISNYFGPSFSLKDEEQERLIYKMLQELDQLEENKMESNETTMDEDMATMSKMSSNKIIVPVTNPESEDDHTVAAPIKTDGRKGQRKTVDPLTGETSYGLTKDGRKRGKPGRKPSKKQS